MTQHQRATIQLCSKITPRLYRERGRGGEGEKEKVLYWRVIRYKKPLFRLISLLTTISLTVAWADYSLPQIVRDRTLGTEGSTVRSNVNIKGLPAELIEGGATRGVNLFHSFSEFNIGEGQRVYFANPAQIENILSRVTGSSRSDIFGTLGVLGNANLFLINPNGIIFGRNAQLDIRGSFVASTASSLTFPDGSQFSATNPQAPPLLTINVPIGLQYGAPKSDPTIANAGNLVVGQDLTLAATNLNLQGQLQAGRNLTLLATDSVRVRDSINYPFIAAAEGQLLIQGNQRVNIFALNHPNSGFFSGGDMVLRSANTIGGDAHYWSGGNFRIEQLDGSTGNFYSGDDPIVLAVNDVSIGDYTGASLHILAGGSVELGDVTIDRVGETDTTINGNNREKIPGTNTSYRALSRVTLSDGKTQLNINGDTQATLDVRAGIDWNQSPFTGAPTGSEPTVNPMGSVNFRSPRSNDATITTGNISVTQPDGLVYLTNQYHPNSLTTGGITVGAITTTIPLSFDFGDGGDVVIDSRNEIKVTGNIDATGRFRGGNGGDITLLGNGNITLNPNLSILSNASPIPIIPGFTSGGLGGTIIFNSRQSDIVVPGGLIFSSSNSNTPGTGGDIMIMGRSFYATDETKLSTTTNLGQANGGDIIIQASDQVTLDNSGVSSTAFSVGNGGDIRITTSSLNLINATLDSTIRGSGDGGDLILEATDTVRVEGSQAKSTVRSGASGEGGDIRITTGSLSITNSSSDPSDSASTLLVTSLLTRTDGVGNAGTIVIEAKDRISITNKLSNEPDQDLVLNSTTTAEGNAGTIIIQAPNADLVVEGAIQLFTSVDPGATGKGGNIRIEGRSLSLNNGVEFSARTAGQANAGNVNLNVTDNLAIADSNIFTSVEAGAIGEGGNIKLTGQSLSFDNAEVSAATWGTGNAGRISVQGDETVTISNSLISTAVNEGAIGDGGKIKIDTGILSLNNNSEITASTAGDGKAGTIEINADQIIINNASLRTTTASSDNAGDIILIAEDTINLSGTDSGLFANTEFGSTGDGGNIFIDPRTVIIRDGARVAVDSQGSGKGGNITLLAGFLSLDNQALISAETKSTDGGDITLQVGDALVLRDQSNISTTAGTAQDGGNGGNITINAPFIVGISKEDSNIAADAFEGRGGNIKIGTQGIFGLEFRNQKTELSDITATSEIGVDGVVEINGPDVDPSQGLVILPTNLADLSGLIAQSCSAGEEATASEISTFMISGRGGLPPNPNQTLNSDAVWQDWRFVDGQVANFSNHNKPGDNLGINSTVPATRQIVEAQGWVKRADGSVILVSQAPTVTLHSSGLSSASCVRH